ncbi:mitochondrial ATP synthase epsilon chain-domain-containing protein [Suillus discolor]|uniref:Mitochondrial ATP synthase epsilon chain-domain-containing protein n=1 Tax=Suillus discolor TaxID=1912936 RepID=A0A9P7F6E9_9AGAM|nr:mitochondrial ATP synthase epsilon chain-domain-containing protein [Suillus discolor]KAG2106791.1 mitochondrial ATP synthase epsilon chain-domain-containing protein [Suillus discolor]
MSSATWRNFFTYNKYAQITARAVRQSLKESERVVAEKRGTTALKYQQWENGVGGPQVRSSYVFNLDRRISDDVLFHTGTPELRGGQEIEKSAAV